MENTEAFEYRTSSGHVTWIVISAVFFAAIGSLVDEFYMLVCWGLAICFFAYSVLLAVDKRVKLRIDQEGISGGRVSRGKISWDQVRRFAKIDESRNGVVVKQSLQLELTSGEKIQVEISRLDSSEAKILKTIERFTGPLYLE